MNDKNRDIFMPIKKDKLLTTYHYIWIFIFGSVFGTLYEEIITIVKLGYYENRSSVILGPFNPLYGVAYLLAVFLFYKWTNPIKIIIVASIFGGAFEYFANWAQEFFTGSVSWNYYELPLHINGRTTVIYALFWGILIYVSVRFFTPYYIRFIDNVRPKFEPRFTILFMIFLSLNMLVTYSMLIRQGLRAKGVEPYTPIGAYYDEVFTDEYIKNKFPNMVLIEDEQDEE